jgi:hypothetical protein
MVRWEGEGGEVEGERELSTVEKRRIARAEKERKAKMISKDQRLLEVRPCPCGRRHHDRSKM